MDDIAMTVIENRQRSKSNEHRIEALEKSNEAVVALAKSFSAMSQKQEDMDADIKEMKADVRRLADKPGKRWEAAAGYIMAALASGIVGYFLSGLLI